MKEPKRGRVGDLPSMALKPYIELHWAAAFPDNRFAQVAVSTWPQVSQTAVRQLNCPTLAWVVLHFNTVLNKRLAWKNYALGTHTRHFEVSEMKSFCGEVAGISSIHGWQVSRGQVVCATLHSRAFKRHLRVSEVHFVSGLMCVEICNGDGVYAGRFEGLVGGWEGWRVEQQGLCQPHTPYISLFSPHTCPHMPADVTRTWELTSSAFLKSLTFPHFVSS